MPLSPENLALIDAAREIIRLRQKEDWHHVGCALRTRSGKVFQAVHIEAFVGRVTVCAEAIARDRIDRGERLIEQEQVWTQHHGAGKRDAMPFSP